MTYNNALKYLDTFINYEKFDGFSPDRAFNLERMRWLLARFDNPEKAFKSIHIAGSKGKGSTSAMVFSILKSAGFRAGLYTSPHLDDVRERIRTDKGLIKEKELSEIIETLKPVIEEYNKEAKLGAFSFFEVFTAAALMYFRIQRIDFAVLEVGLGGRLDATNAVDGFVCGITPISFEHTDKLGGTIAAIATEKAEIIKEESIVVSALQADPAMRIIESKCASTSSQLYLLGRDFKFNCTGYDDGFERFNFVGIASRYKDIEVNLIGTHQAANAAMALGIIDALKISQFDISETSVREGLRNVDWPGRCEVAGKDPLIIFDGAQNRASARVIINTIPARFRYDTLFVILGTSKDKDIAGICDELEAVADKIIVTVSSHPRASSAENIMRHIGDKTKAMSIPSLTDALDVVFHIASETDLILVTGSLFLVSEARRMYRLNKDRFKEEVLLA